MNVQYELYTLSLSLSSFHRCLETFSDSFFCRIRGIYSKHTRICMQSLCFTLLSRVIIISVFLFSLHLFYSRTYSIFLRLFFRISHLLVPGFFFLSTTLLRTYVCIYMVPSKLKLKTSHRIKRRTDEREKDRKTD